MSLVSAQQHVRLPAYRELGAERCAPYRSAWGVFGEDDQVGTLNLLTPDIVRAAASLIRRGVVFPLNWRIDLPDPPILGRNRLRRTVLELDPRPNPGTDDLFDNFYTQGSSQWDALCHVGHRQYGYYNGRVFDDIVNRHQDGIDQWATRGIAGRFVLADVARYRESIGSSLPTDERVAVTADELEATLQSEHVTLQHGDILLLRFGWIGWYDSLDEAGRGRLVESFWFPAPGLSSDESTAEWLWDRHVAAVAADCPALEAMPIDKSSMATFLHYRLIVFLGMAVGELFDLERLAADCAFSRVYEGFFTAAPLNVPGGAGSTANALAIV